MTDAAGPLTPEKLKQLKELKSLPPKQRAEIMTEMLRQLAFQSQLPGPGNPLKIPWQDPSKSPIPLPPGPIPHLPPGYKRRT